MFASAILCASLLLAQNDKEPENLQGDWIGKWLAEPSKEAGRQTTYTFKGNVCSFETPSGTTGTFKFQIDDSHEPKHFDKLQRNNGLWLGIYKIEGDTLTICIGTQDKRPTEFKAGENGGDLAVWKRKPN